MTTYLIFTYHALGCSLSISQDGPQGHESHIAEFDALDLLRMGIEPTRLFTFMEYGTKMYYPIAEESSTVAVPQAFYDAFEQKEKLS